MSLQFDCKDFDDVLFQLSDWIMKNFKCNTSKEEDVTITSSSPFYSSDGNIAKLVKRHPKKMIHLRSIYVEDGEIDRAHYEMIRNGSAEFKFKNVQHEFDHVRGGCLTSMTISPERVTIAMRASVIPWNLQFDLALISDLMRDLGLKPSSIVFKIGYIRTKVIHALYTFLLHGWNPEDLCSYRFGRSMISAYMRARKPECKYRNWIGFAGRVDKVREELGIGELSDYLAKAQTTSD